MKQTKKTAKKIMFKDGDKTLSLERQGEDLEVKIGMPHYTKDEKLFTTANVVSIIAWMKKAVLTTE